MVVTYSGHLAAIPSVKRHQFISNLGDPLEIVLIIEPTFHDRRYRNGRLTTY